MPSVYPLPALDDDHRFTFGLILDVANVLARHGYPKITSPDRAADLVDLQQALFGFLYATDDPPATPATGAIDPTSEEC